MQKIEKNLENMLDIGLDLPKSKVVNNLIKTTSKVLKKLVYQQL